MEKNMAHGMEARIIQGFILVVVTTVAVGGCQGILKG